MIPKDLQKKFEADQESIKSATRGGKCAAKTFEDRMWQGIPYGQRANYVNGLFSTFDRIWLENEAMIQKNKTS